MLQLEETEWKRWEKTWCGTRSQALSSDDKSTLQEDVEEFKQRAVFRRAVSKLRLWVWWHSRWENDIGCKVREPSTCLCAHHYRWRKHFCLYYCQCRQWCLNEFNWCSLVPREQVCNKENKIAPNTCLSFTVDMLLRNLVSFYV